MFNLLHSLDEHKTELSTAVLNLAAVLKPHLFFRWISSPFLVFAKLTGHFFIQNNVSISFK